MEHKISPKRALLDMLGVKEQVFEFYKSEEKYLPILTFMMAKDYYNDDDVQLPSLKEVEASTGIKSYHIRKLLLEMYEKLFDYNSGYKFGFGQTEIMFFASYMKNYAMFRCKNLKHIPRVGEHLDIHFLKAKINFHHFYVSEVVHSLESNTQVIEIRLEGGHYNSYWEFRKDKALELGEIGLREFYDMYEFQLKKKLLYNNIECFWNSSVYLMNS